MQRIRRFFRSESGIAAVEFALIAPVMMLLFLGGVEMARYILIHQKIDRAANTIADNIAQMEAVTTGDLNILFAAANDLVRPYDMQTNGEIIISSVTKTGTNNPLVVWQYRSNTVPSKTSHIGAVNGTATLPNGFTMQANDDLIVAEVFYDFTPMVGETVMEGGGIYKVAYFRPRLGALDTLN